MMIQAHDAAPLLAAAALLLLACAPQPMNGNGAGAPFAELTVNPASVRPGGTVTLTLTNRSQQQIGYNLCPASLERQAGDAWQLHPQPLVDACTMELRVLEPGASGSFEHRMPATLPPGTYRFALGVEWPLGEDRVGMHSGAFQVTADE